MIAKEYQEFLKKELNFSAYLLLTLVVASLQLLKQVKLEVLAEALPLPILFESRRRKLRRFLKLDKLSIETLWFPCIKISLKEMFSPNDIVYLAIDRTSWGLINILMVSLVYDHRSWPIYWKFLDKQGSSNLAEQQEVLSQVLQLISEYIPVVLGDREFCSTKLGDWLGQKGAYFCLRQKCDTKIRQSNGLYQELREKRFNIEEMFRDFKLGGYNLEGSQLASELLSKLMIVVAIAYTSATLQGRQIKRMGIQKYVARPETQAKGQRRHSSFYIGQHLYNWLRLQQLCQETVDELLQINRRWLNHYKKGQRAIALALSTF